MKNAANLLMTVCSLALAGGLSMETAAAQPDTSQPHPFSSSARQKAEALLKQKTVDEKIGQLDQTSGIVMPGIATWPRTAGSEPLYYNHNLTHEPEDRPNFTSRYWDVSSKPLYPFGFGLSYTTFKFSNLKISKTSMPATGTNQVSVDVTNSGAVEGDAVAQLYIHQRYGSASRPVRQLEGFKRVSLKPGETQTLTFTLGKDELEFWSPATKAWTVEASDFDLWLGEDSTATLHSEFKVTEQ